MIALAVGLSGFGDISFAFDDDTTLAVRIYSGIFFVFLGGSGLTSMAVRWASLRMAAAEAKTSLPEYSILQRRIATVEAAIHTNRMTNLEPEEA
jgi:hypothetical protein